MKFILAPLATLLFQSVTSLPFFKPAGGFDATMKCSRCLRNANTFCAPRAVWFRQIDTAAANSPDNPKDDYANVAKSVCCNLATPNAACNSGFTDEANDADTVIWCSSDFATVDKALLACPIEMTAKCNTHSTDAPTMINKNPPVYKVLGKTAETKTWEVKGLTKEDHCKIIIKA